MSATVGRSVAQLLVTMTGTSYVEGVMAVPTSATAIPLGGVATPGWGFFLNLDATNKINLRSGVAGTNVVAILAGEFAMFRWEGTVVPYAHSNIAVCNLEYLILSS